MPLRAKLHYTTLIVLPDGEDVVEATCGDKEFWIVNVRGGLVSVKPAKAGSETNLNLVTTSGQVYAFLLTEVSADKGQDADLTVYLEPDALDGAAVTRARPKFVPAEQVEDFRAQADLAREQARRATETARADLEAGHDGVSHELPAQPAVSVSLQGGHEALLSARHVSRRSPDVHPVGRARTADALRAQGRRSPTS